MKDKPSWIGLAFAGLITVGGLLITCRGWIYSRKAPGAIEEGIHVRIHGALLLIVGLALLINYLKRRIEFSREKTNRLEEAE